METIRIRPWQLSDESALLRYANNRKVWINMNDIFPHPYTPADADRWLWRCGSRQAPHLHFAVDLADEAIGSVGIDTGQTPPIERQRASVIGSLSRSENSKTSKGHWGVLFVLPPNGTEASIFNLVRGSPLLSF